MTQHSYDADAYFETVTYFSQPGVGFVEPKPAARWAAWWHFRAEGADPGSALATAAGQGFVLSTAQLGSLGYSRAQVRTLVGNGTWTAPRPGVVAPLDVRQPTHGVAPDTWLIARRAHALAATSAALMNRSHVVSGASAAVLHGVPTLALAAQPVLTSAGPAGGGARPAGASRGGRRGRVLARCAELSAPEVTSWFGTPVTTVARTAVDLARLDRRDGLIFADAALADGLLDARRIAEALTAAAGWPGIVAARAVLELASHLSESPLESLVRLRLHDDGFPPPQLQVEIAVPGRRVPYRVDLYWPEYGLVLEADGRDKYTGDELWREKRREADLRALGLRIERVRWVDVVHEWPRTRVLLERALRGRR